MSTSVGEIGLDLVVNQNQFNKQIRGINSIAKKAGVALAAAFSVKKIVDFGKSCVNLGSDLQEVQNVVDVTFPHMSAQVDKFAKNAAGSFGLSETMAKKFTGTFGAMAKSFGFSESAAYEMSTMLTGLAGDIASFYNLSQDEAYTKLKSVFTGETEALKELGVVMTQSALDAYALANGYGKTTKAMSEAEKVALRYAFVQNQLTVASGDFARTSDSWANQVRILKLNFESLKATIGQGLINVLTPVIKVINLIISKIMVLANAFKAFTELITGKKNKGSSGISEMASAAGGASESMAGASGAADNLANSARKAGGAAKKAAKEMRTLMGFDQINKLQEQSDDSGASGGGAGGGSASGGGMDFGSLATGETVVDKLDKKLQSLIDRCKELAALFKKGFVIGFGDSEKRIKSIQKHIDGIGKSLKEIFTDKSVVNAANKMFDSIALNAGKVAGSMVSVGITIADNLVGGIDKYLQRSKDYIKNRLIGIFDVTSEILNLVGDFSVAFAEVFSIFSGENAKECTASIIGIFSDGFLGTLELAGQFAADIINRITQPFVENKDAIKEAVDNTLAPISEVLGTIHEYVTYVFSEINRVYQEHISPLFQSFADGWSEICGTLTAGYNEYIAPILDAFAKKFKAVYQEHIKPTIDKGLELIAKVSDATKKLWEEVLQPFLNWIAEKIYPVIAPILESISEKFLEKVSAITDGIGLIFDVLNRLIDFIDGVFEGNWKKAWNAIKDIFKTIWDEMVGNVRNPINKIIGFINQMIRGVVSGMNGVIRAMNRLSFKIPDWVPAPFGGKKFGLNIPKVSAPQIPYLAQGGYVKPNTPQLAMIGDNRHQGEVVAPEKKLTEMAIAAAKAVAGSGGITKSELEQIVNAAVMKIVAALTGLGFYVDSELIALAVQRGMRSLDERYNPVEFL